MKITGVKTFVVGNPAPHWGGRNWVFLKLNTDEGIDGIGECNFAWHREHTIVRLIEELAGPYVIGTNPFNTEKLWETLYGGDHFFRHPEIVTTQVISAFEMACWDIVGKALNQPIYNLLGGKIREKLRAYSYISCVDNPWRPPDSPEKAGESAAAMVERGFTALKLDPIPPIAPGPREVTLKELRYTDAVLKNIRDAVEDKADILMGTHGQLNTHSAIRFAKVIEPYSPQWFEEPVSPENVEEMARVAQHTSIPIATGERLSTKHDFLRLLQSQAVQIVQAHTGLNGITEMKKIAGIAEAFYAQMAPWMHCGPVAAAANVQIDMTIPNFLMQEGINDWSGFHAEILKEPIIWEKGYIIPPERPGLGIELNEKLAEKHPFIPWDRK